MTFQSTIAHESSHAIFEYHSVRGSAETAGRVPDALAERIASLYIALLPTKPVPQPKSKFDENSPPPLLVIGDESVHPAGLVMVTDTLWAGSGGHPWHGVDEFFASAYGGFIQQRMLQRKIMGYYQKFDPAIKPLAAQLLGLLATIAKPTEYQHLRGPKDAAEAREALKTISAPLEFTKEHYAAGWFIDPSSMPSPDKIDCSKPTTTKKENEEFLDSLIK